MAVKRSAKATASVRPKRITARQKVARKKNIAIARKHKKKGKGSGGPSKASLAVVDAVIAGIKKQDSIRSGIKKLKRKRRSVSKERSLDYDKINKQIKKEKALGMGVKKLLKRSNMARRKSKDTARSLLNKI